MINSEIENLNSEIATFIINFINFPSIHLAYFEADEECCEDTVVGDGDDCCGDEAYFKSGNQCCEYDGDSKVGAPKKITNRSDVNFGWTYFSVHYKIYP